MVMVRWTGVWARVRLSACERATAKSMDVAVASRCAAAMNASASCGLSVPSAWRSRAAMRASILSSVIAPNYGTAPTFRCGDSQPCVDPAGHVVEHLVALGLVEHLVVEPRINFQLDVGATNAIDQLAAAVDADQPILSAVHDQQRCSQRRSALGHGFAHQQQRAGYSGRNL